MKTVPRFSIAGSRFAPDWPNAFVSIFPTPK
jgi:hypothetical protein